MKRSAIINLKKYNDLIKEFSVVLSTDSLKLRGEQPLNTQHSKGFLKLLDVSDSAFEELYCCTFELLDKIWLEMHASYMQFPEVMRFVPCNVHGDCQDSGVACQVFLAYPTSDHHQATDAVS